MAVFQSPFLLDLGLVFLIEHVLALLQTAFLLADLGAGFLHLPVEIFAFPEQLILGFEFGIADDAVGFLAGLIG